MGSNAVVEENRQSGNCNIVTQSVGSSIKIDSISIDLVSSNDKGNAAKCEHFSIRGYVSEIRQKDWRKCWPFSSDDNPNKSVEQTCMLPPLEVSKFKWWHCQHCLLEFGAKDAADNYGTRNDHGTSRLKSNTVCSHGMSLGDVSMLPSEFQEALKVDIFEGKKFDVNSPKLSTDCQLSSCRDKKENETEVVKCPNIGHEIDLEVEVSREIPPSSYIATEDVSNLMQERHNPDVTVAFPAQCNGSGDFCEPGCGQVEHADRNLNCIASINIAETSTKGQETSADNQLTELMTACGIAEEFDETLNANKRHATRHPSVESEDCDCTSYESAEIPVGNDLRDSHHDKAINLHRRKTRKVRLLTELLCEKGDADGNHFGKEESSSNSIFDASADADTLSAPQGMVAIQGNVPSMGPNRKRKLSRDEEWRSMGTSVPDNIDKRVGVLKGDVETTNAIAGPVLEKDLSAGMGLQTGMKSDLSKNRKGKSPIIGKRKNERIHILDECQPLGPSQMEVPRKNQDETVVGYEGDADDDISFKLVHGAFGGREMDLFPLPDQRAKRKSTSCKKNSKVHQSDDRKASLMPWTTWMAKEGSSTRKDVQSMPTVISCVPFQSAQLAATDRGLDLSLSSCLAVERSNGSFAPQAEGGKTSFLPWQKAISEDQALMSKRASGGRSKGPHLGFSSKRTSYGAPFFDEKHSHPSLVESSDLSLLQKKDFCNTSNGKKNIKVHEHPLFTKKDMDRADNESEQVAMDDVPMEIVELMAKNQYERCLPDADNDKIPLDMTNLTRNLQTRNFNKPCSNGAFSSFQEEAGPKQKPYAKNGRNGVITRCEILGSAKQKSAVSLCKEDTNHFSRSQIGQTQRPVGFQAFLQHPEEQSGGFRYSAGSSSGQNGSENCKWIGDMVGKRPPNASCWQTFGPCNTSPGVPRQNKEGANIWPYILPNNSPFIYNVPQKHAVTSADRDLLSRCPGTLLNGNPNGEHDMSSFNQNAARVGQHKENCGSKSIGRTHAENLFSHRHDRMKLQHKKMGSLDMYTNETIPAMHLLSLMDAGLQSSKPISMDVNPKFLKKPLMAHDSQPDFPGLESVVRSPSYDYYSKNKFPENSHEPFPTFPMVGASASLFQHDRSSKKATNFPDEGSWKSQENKKRKTSNSSAHNKGCGPQNSLSTGGGFGTGSGSVPARCKQKMFLGASDHIVFPTRFHGMQGSTNSILEAPSATGTLRPLKRSSETEICSINRNPADFSLPEAGNLYTIGGEDLKFRAAVTHPNRTGLEKLNGRKRQPKIPGMKQAVQRRA
ncbi:protein EMBRYONIC FLOWER 1-like isoform X1 [Tripterygium wilfordii]|uniref:Protein EMBRYONIC FLOWER 1-like isoform X1 n=1 Tax=Tripterygium wilfordii TaxID=458696 RepID=A0A7J7BWE1_TRIWF|nr:protein EMBRYONIC FLOWER 1 [Tripterygium wilfordii]XP_038696590.1 protein EMBRYONIC FLOWER 1 [Tripterygium wilfordii]KAF5726191.1 protein EMBRYONIC FLOWER 1-like isoform X1 [Tripterygium wilfordii]